MEITKNREFLNTFVSRLICKHFTMKIVFKDDALEELFITGKTRDSKYKQLCKDKKLVDGYIRAVKVMQQVASAKDLVLFSFLHYERLKYFDLSSIRIVNGKIDRLLFKEVEEGIEVELIEIDNTHYGNKK
jgi:plasmid maintenance system killer protein